MGQIITVDFRKRRVMAGRDDRLSPGRQPRTGKFKSHKELSNMNINPGKTEFTTAERAALRAHSPAAA